MTTNRAFEVVPLTIRDGVSVEEFAALDHAVEREHVALQPGFISRQSGAGQHGTWRVVVQWTSVADAEASMASFSNASAASAFMAAIKPGSMVMTRSGAAAAAYRS